MKLASIGFLAFVVISSLATAETTVSVVPPTPPLQVTETITLAGLLPANTLSELKQGDVFVIDLRTVEEGIEQEPEMLSAANLDYVNLPMGRSPGTLTARACIGRAFFTTDQRPFRVPNHRPLRLWESSGFALGSTPYQSRGLC